MKLMEMGEEVQGEEEEEGLAALLPSLMKFAISRQPSASDISKMSYLSLLIYLAQVRGVAALLGAQGNKCLAYDNQAYLALARLWLQAGAEKEAAACVRRSDLEALAARKANAWEIRRILAAADSLSSTSELPLAQAAIMMDALGEEKQLRGLYNKLSLRVSRGGHLPIH